MPKGKPFSSQAQRGLMHAVAEGRARQSDIPQVAKRLVAEDEGGKLPKRSRKRLSAAVTANQRKNNLAGD